MSFIEETVILNTEVMYRQGEVHSSHRLGLADMLIFSLGVLEGIDKHTRIDVSYKDGGFSFTSTDPSQVALFFDETGMSTISKDKPVLLQNELRSIIPLFETLSVEYKYGYLSYSITYSDNRLQVSKTSADCDDYIQVRGTLLPDSIPSGYNLSEELNKTLRMVSHHGTFFAHPKYVVLSSEEEIIEYSPTNTGVHKYLLDNPNYYVNPSTPERFGLEVASFLHQMSSGGVDFYYGSEILDIEPLFNEMKELLSPSQWADFSDLTTENRLVVITETTPHDHMGSADQLSFTSMRRDKVSSKEYYTSVSESVVKYLKDWLLV